ncbi:MAG: phosphoribosyltransferase family protein [bacterium]
MFEYRKDAGERLARALEKYKGEDVLVLAIPRGGVEVAYEVAKYLGVDYSLLVARKLPYPHNPETGFGAVAEDGSIFIFERAAVWLGRKRIEKITKEQLREIIRRIDVLRKGKPLPEISGRTVVLVDDGLAMGSTMRAAIMLCKNKKAAKIVVAVPVAGREVANEIAAIVDELVVLEVPPFFQAVAQVYRNWYDVGDEEVLEIMARPT